MAVRQKELVCVRIYIEQPHLLASVVVLPRLEVPMEAVDVVLNILIVLMLAVETSGQRLNVVSEDDQEREMARLVSAIGFSEGLDDASMKQSLEQMTAFRHEPVLLAYVIDTLRRAGLAVIRSKAEKYPVLAAVNLVNCVATAQRAQRPRSGDHLS